MDVEQCGDSDSTLAGGLNLLDTLKAVFCDARSDRSDHRLCECSEGSVFGAVWAGLLQSFLWLILSKMISRNIILLFALKNPLSGGF